MKRPLFVIAACVLLGACGSSVPTAIPAGVYTGTGHFTGTQTVNGATRPFNTAPFMLAIVTAAGNYQLLSYSSGGPGVVSQLDRGSGSVVDGSFVGSNDIEAGMYPDYNSNNFPILYASQGASLTAPIVPKTSLSGTLTYPGTQGAVLSFPVNWAAGSTGAASLASIARTYTGAFYANVNTGQNINQNAAATITVSPAGALSGTVSCPYSSINPPPPPQTPCTVSGTMAPRQDINAYDVSIAFINGSSTAYPSAWVGKTAVGLGYSDAASGKLMFGAAAPDNTAFAFSN